MLTATRGKNVKARFPALRVSWLATGIQDTQCAFGDQHGIRSGYGRCSQCACQNFEGNSQQCGNCGHNYSDHYSY